mgnify:CR=1 FL=1
MGLCHSSKNQRIHELRCKYEQTVKAASFKMNTFLKEFFTIIIELSYPSPSQMLGLKAHFHNPPHSINACKNHINEITLLDCIAT